MANPSSELERLTDVEPKIPIVLASASPRRRDLVRRIGFEPTVRVSDVPEEKSEEESAREYVERLARAKAEDVEETVAGEAELPNWLLAADTIVRLGESVLEKPSDRDEAAAMLTEMAGSWHEVLTSFYWLERGGERRCRRTVVTEVRLRNLPEVFIERYVATGEPMDKAGSYGIQDFGSLLVRELHGSYFNVVGLPLCEVVESLEDLDALEIHPLLGSGVGEDPPVITSDER